MKKKVALETHNSIRNKATLYILKFKNILTITPKSLLLIFIFVCTASPMLFSQSKDGEIKTPEFFTAPYIRITSVEVNGNEKTKDKILLRELDFQIGDSLATYEKINPTFSIEQKRFNKSDSIEVIRRLKYSRENLINTKLFLVVDLTLERITERDYNLKIDVQERWYFWVFPIIKLDHPNFNDWLKDPDYDLINKGLFASHNNMFGLSHQASVIGSFGSSYSAGLGYYMPWIGNGQKIGLRVGAILKSSAVVEYGSVNNERQMMYDKNSMKELLLSTTITIRPALYSYATIKMNAGYVEISDSLKSVSPNYLPDNKSQVSMVNLYLDYYYDSRNNKAYPLEGNYMKAFADKKGLGIISHDVDYFHYGIDVHFYQKLGEKFYMAEMLKLVKSSSQNIPYYFKQTLTSGKDFIRGYDYYALRGDEMYYFRNNLKYELIKPGVRKARNEKYAESKFRNVPYAFYLNLFADAGLLVDDFDGGINPYSNKILYSWGLGIDFITYYDLVLRFEYAFTSIGTHGFFFGFGMPI